MKSYNKKYVYFICLVSAMGGLLFGYDWVVLEGTKPFYELYFDIVDAPTMQGLAMSVALLGCLIGVMVSGMMADRYGRKPFLLISAFSAVVWRYGYMHFCFMGRKFHADIYISIAEYRFGKLRHILDLLGYLCSRVHILLSYTTRDEGKISGNFREGFNKIKMDR